jgi:hypothetical protein
MDTAFDAGIAEDGIRSPPRIERQLPVPAGSQRSNLVQGIG